MNKIFTNLLGKTMEVYIDDILVKSTKASNHISHLEECFKVLKKHNMKLNLAKCSFGMGSKKFLGFLVKKRGIEVSLE